MSKCWGSYILRKPHDFIWNYLVRSKKPGNYLWPSRNIWTLSNLSRWVLFLVFWCYWWRPRTKSVFLHFYYGSIQDARIVLYRYLYIMNSFICTYLLTYTCIIRLMYNWCSRLAVKREQMNFLFLFLTRQYRYVRYLHLVDRMYFFSNL